MLSKWFCGLSDFDFSFFGVMDGTFVQGASCIIIIIINNNSFERSI
jgi:hypothetical protein